MSSDLSVLIVEHWEDAVQKRIDPKEVQSIAPKIDDKPNHCHPGFGRAEPWTVKFRNGNSMDINGCPEALEQFRLAP